MKLSISSALGRGRGNIGAAFRSESGAFDLPSIMVGVAVVAILTGGVLAAIFGVIPWAQDNQAQQSVSAVVTAEGTYYAQQSDSGAAYTDLAGLKTEELLGSDVDAEEVAAVGNGAGFAVIVESATGKYYLATSAAPKPVVTTVAAVGDSATAAELVTAANAALAAL